MIFSEQQNRDLRSIESTQHIDGFLEGVEDADVLLTAIFELVFFVAYIVLLRLVTLVCPLRFAITDHSAPECKEL